MDPDVVVDNEFEPREADAVVRQTRDRKRVVRVADIHHDLRPRSLFVGDLVLVDLEFDLAVIDVSAVALGTRDGDLGAAFDLFGRVACADDARNTKFAADDRAVASAAAAVGNDRRRTLHDRLPRRDRSLL